MMHQQQRPAAPRRAGVESVGIDFVPEHDPDADADAETMPWPPSEHPAAPPRGNVIDGLGGWQDFELMPPRYRSRRHAQHALQRWSGVLLVLLSITIGSAAAVWMRGRRTIARNADLLTQAQPIADLRKTTRLLESETALLEKWCGWVESAKPDDGVAQVMGAVTRATHPDPPSPPALHLDVQSIEIKLPLEYDTSVKQPPAWATPRFSLTVIANSRDVLMPWNDRLEQTGRLRDVKLNTPGGAWREALIQVSAQPLTSRLVP